MTTLTALQDLTLHEKAFFWGYTVVTLAFGIFILALAWKVLFGARRHPMPRRAISWNLPEKEVRG